jgi:hypothetical protein
MPRLGRDDLGTADWAICAVLRREAEVLFLDRDFPADAFVRGPGDLIELGPADGAAAMRPPWAAPCDSRSGPD